MGFSMLLGELHPRLVAFPIVLVLVALVFDAAAFLHRSPRAAWCGRALLLAGTATLLLAFICGICAEIFAGRAGVPHDQIEFHEFAATVASWGCIALTAWRLFLDPARRRGLFAAYLVCGVALYAVFVATGWLGGKLVTEYGASVAGADAKTVLSLHDLNTLAQRQTDLNLQYSDLMHRSAGAFVLVLTLAIFVRELWPRHAHRVRWVGPALLVIGGVLLFLTADLDLYALTDPRQFLDREVQAHKLIASILTGVGLRMWLKQRRAPVTQPTGSPGVHQNRLVAVVALVGGGLLFTHIHTVAPYANVAAGVYINHIVMGFVALAIGGARLLDDALPNPSRRRAALFPSLLLIESFLLLTYTEGIPWWAGVGHYNRWGPNDGTVAPFTLAGARAELLCDNATGTLDLRVLDKHADTPASVPVTNATVVIAQGYRETAVTLAAVDAAGNEASHFRGRAAFLKGALQFSARVTLPLDGRERTGHFDPWVTPAIAGIPPNKVARYVCPMHEGIRSEELGDCRLCGMPLVPLQRTARTELHDAKYAMKFEHTGDALRFTPQFATTGATVRDLLVVHEYRLHLIIVSDDLAFFDHVHPVRHDDGSFALDYKFPRTGNYLLFADITPAGERAQVFRIPVNPETTAAINHEPLAMSSALSREIGAYHAEMIVQPRTLVAGRHAHLAFRLEREGRPVTDLWPYIGAMGHCVIISEDTREYLHSHPEQFSAAPASDDRGGPEVSFHTTFPKPGRYRVWGQFKRGDEIIIADFVIEVNRPLLPQWLVNALLFD